MRVLAIDPGYERLGIAIIERAINRKDTLVYSDCFKTKSSSSFYARLSGIGLELENLIKKYKPEVLAIEKLYLTTNQKTVMNVAEVRGAIIYIATTNNLKIFEYTPPQVKVAVTGYGKASKDMVIKMVSKLIKIDKKTNSDDELDAIAIGLTCLACEKFKV
ncbi:MAG: crossover junction endodeoxyribonuclease RuvC [Patescibacteria group bacterium]